jgi:hypothetical protein
VQVIPAKSFLHRHHGRPELACEHPPRVICRPRFRRTLEVDSRHELQVVLMTLVELMVVGSVAEDPKSLAEVGVTRSVPCTVLEVPVRDQSALYGLLQRLATLGLELLELRTVPSSGRADLEIIVRGPIGGVLQAMLREVDRTTPAEVTSYRVQEADVGALLGVLDDIASSPARGGETTPPTAPVSAANRPAASGGTGTAETISQLRELARLRDQGILTDAEFATQKARILE